jgi:hypothetical protein
MPRLAELSAEPKSVKISYTDLPDVSQIIFVGANIRTVTAIHRWFGAQRSERDSDARTE